MEDWGWRPRLVVGRGYRRAARHYGQPIDQTTFSTGLLRNEHTGHARPLTRPTDTLSLKGTRELMRAC